MLYGSKLLAALTSMLTKTNCCCGCSYNPDLDSDPYGEEGSLWSFNYFFYNKKMRRILFFTCRATRWYTMPIFIFSVLTCRCMKRNEQVLVVGGALSHHGSIVSFPVIGWGQINSPQVLNSQRKTSSCLIFKTQQARFYLKLPTCHFCLLSCRNIVKIDNLKSSQVSYDHRS